MYHPMTRASLNLTRACNLRCSYCFTRGCTHGRMSDDTAFKIVNFLFANAEMCKQPRDRAVEISFWGGEPLLEWNLLQRITLYAEDVSRRLAIPVTFTGTTNGTLLTPEKFDFLDAHRTFFLVSFDGTKETHDYYRKMVNGQGSHDLIEKNLKIILQRWPFYQTRMGPFPERIDHFFEDCKYTYDLGIRHLIFSPVYEGNWTDEKWAIFEDQAMQLVDFIAEKQKEGITLTVEHFKQYTRIDDSKWPCGAGRFYVGFDIDGAIYPCHRFNKFDDTRPWQEKEVCIGHVDHGITRPEFRDQFIDFKPQCGGCPRLKDTPCHGGCYAVNWDFNKDIMKPHEGVCRYVQMQQRVSAYYKEKVMDKDMQEASCMPYHGLDGSSCKCFNANYTGAAQPPISDEVIALLLQDLNRRVAALEAKVNG